MRARENGTDKGRERKSSRRGCDTRKQDRFKAEVL